MITINCVIVDDEPVARNILETFVAKIPNFKFGKKLQKCNGGFRSIQILKI